MLGVDVVGLLFCLRVGHFFVSAGGERREEVEVEKTKKRTNKKKKRTNKKKKKGPRRSFCSAISMPDSTIQLLLFGPKRASRGFLSTWNTPSEREGGRIPHGEPAAESGKERSEFSLLLHPSRLQTIDERKKKKKVAVPLSLRHSRRFDHAGKHTI